MEYLDNLKFNARVKYHTLKYKAKKKYKQVMPEKREDRETVYAVGLVVLTTTVSVTSFVRNFGKK